MKKGYIIAAAVWLGLLAVIALAYSITHPNEFHINWALSEFSDPLKFVTVGLPILILGLLVGSLALARDHERVARTMVQISFVILLVLSVTAILSVFGLLIAPAAWFAYRAMAGNGQQKAAWGAFKMTMDNRP